MDILLSYGKDEWSRVRWSGTSALTVVVQNTKKSSEEEKENTLEILEEQTSRPDRKKLAMERLIPNEPEELGLIHVANSGSLFFIWF